ncbi:chaperonin 10-like protein [Podospora aff. communis PSN243]|uniref:Chaperonin 10-like protein n=1 Tax=Podospora aff. communis PSN243 TaxID=3040156 RepID=A0AAV9GQW2_9PEZI|nr:chaperonin 10-like protein [Podospora aff. communis PSN243]
MTQPSLPKTMRSLVAPHYGPPSTYQIQTLPTPTSIPPTSVLLRIHAAEVSTGITQLASGQFRLLTSASFPLPLCIGGSGTVVSIGSAVTTLRAGDPVYGLYFKHGIFPPPVCGFASEYAVVPADVLLPKPESLSFEEAAALSGIGVTAYQCFKRYFELRGMDIKSAGGELEGKTVFATGALSACGSVFAQAAKNVFGARVVATVSTGKMGLVEGILPGVVDELVDYQKEDVVARVGKGKVDLVLNSQWDLVGLFPLANPYTGVVVSIASLPGPETMRRMIGESKVPFAGLIIWLLTLAYMWYDFKLRGTNVKHDFVSGNPGNREDLEASGEWIASGKIKAVMTVVDFNDIDAVRRGCEMVATGKGGLGKLVIKLI